MKRLPPIAERIRRGGPVPLPLAALLAAATPVVRFGMWRRRRLPRIRVDARVISFGNITVGGTGKTPAVIERARAEQAAGHAVAVVTRGYGSKRVPEPAFLDRQMPSCEAAEQFGDEAALIALRAPGVHIIKAADRIAGARYAIEQRGCDTIILDDGYQFLPLERDENILIIDASNPFGNGHLVPRGILREPVEALARATAIILTRCDQADNLDTAVKAVRRVCPNTPLRLTRHAPKRLRRVVDNAPLPLAYLDGHEVEAACAIGNPDAFFRTLEALGASIAARHVFRDHARVSLRPGVPNRPLVVTEKDAVRMRAPGEQVYALGVELEDC